MRILYVVTPQIMVHPPKQPMARDYHIAGYTHVFIILADSKNHYTGSSNTDVYTTTQKKYFKNATKEDLDNRIKDLSGKVSLFDGRIKGLEVDAYGGNKDISIPFPFNPCLFAQNGSDLTSCLRYGLSGFDHL